jgi:chaperonin GroES
MIEPVTNRILIEAFEVPEKQGQFYVTDSAREKPQRGKVIAVGPDCKQIEVGNEVVWAKYLGQELIVDGKKLIVMKEPDAHLIIK